MDIRIEPGRLCGRVAAPVSKSAAHRALLCAALAKGESVLYPFQPVQDMKVTLEAVRSLGTRVSLSGETVTIAGGAEPPRQAAFDCGESGSTFRFLVPIAAALGISARFYGSGRLPERPIAELTEELTRHGAEFHTCGDAMLAVSGRLRPGEYRLAGNVSSQYITGLLLALPLLEGDSEITLTTPLESKGYVDMTLGALAHFGVKAEETQTGYRIPGNQRYQARQFRFEGDYSGAAFWLCANALGSDIAVEGLEPDSRQGDRAIVELLRQMGSPPRAIEIDVSQIPDLLPVLAALLACSEGNGTLYNAARLRLKESDRLATVTAGLRAMGAQVEEHPDRLELWGRASLPGGCTVDSFGDHRIAMAMAIAALRCEAPVIILGAHCVEKSYPTFWEHLKQLGGNCHVL